MLSVYSQVSIVLSHTFEIKFLVIFLYIQLHVTSMHICSDKL
jgi:hypothetical protein